MLLVKIGKEYFVFHGKLTSNLYTYFSGFTFIYTILLHEDLHRV